MHVIALLAVSAASAFLTWLMFVMALAGGDRGGLIVAQIFSFILLAAHLVTTPVALVRTRRRVGISPYLIAASPLLTLVASVFLAGGLWSAYAGLRQALPYDCKLTELQARKSLVGALKQRNLPVSAIPQPDFSDASCTYTYHYASGDTRFDYEVHGTWQGSMIARYVNGKSGR